MIAFCVPILASRCRVLLLIAERQEGIHKLGFVCQLNYVHYVHLSCCLLFTIHLLLGTRFILKRLWGILQCNQQMHTFTLLHTETTFVQVADYISNRSLMEPQLPRCDDGLAFLLYAEEKYFTQEVSRREKEAKWKLNLTLSCPVWVLANKLQLFGGSESELSVSLIWRGFIFVMFSVSSPRKTTNPEVQ